MRQIPSQRFGQETSRGHVGGQRQQKGMFADNYLGYVCDLEKITASLELGNRIKSISVSS